MKKDFDLETSVTERLLLNRICSNFITTNQSGIVQFTHLSVREYLEQKSEEFSLLTAHTLAADCCLSFIQQPDFNFTTALPMEPGFPSYTVRYWSFHLKTASSLGDISESLKNLSHNFLCKGHSVLDWAEAFEYQYSIAKEYEQLLHFYEEKTLEAEVLRRRLTERDEMMSLAYTRIQNKNRKIMYLENHLRPHGFRVED